jgi:hypothetical protein
MLIFLVCIFNDWPLPDPARGWWPGEEPLGAFNGGPLISALVGLLFLAVLVRACKRGRA